MSLHVALTICVLAPAFVLGWKGFETMLVYLCVSSILAATCPLYCFYGSIRDTDDK